MKTRNTRSKKNKRPKKQATRGRSGYEQKVMEFLESQGVQYEYEKDSIPYTVPETKRRYIPDFKVRETYIESKGRWLANDRAKIKRVLAENPGIRLKMLFMRDNPIRKGSSTLYSDWCNKNNIDFAISPSGAVPLRWLKG